MSSPTCHLGHLKVLVTRPHQQAVELLDSLRAHGAEAIALPMLEIVAAPEASTMLTHTMQYHDIIFISANAVNYSLNYFSPARQRVIAIGAATQKALALHGVNADITPLGSSDSEHLLAHPDLQHMQGRRVLIIRGDSGRELIAQQLRANGAIVDYVQVYQRKLPSSADCSALQQQWQTQVDVITTTSNQIISNLLELCGNQTAILQTPIVVISERCAKHARACGFEHIIVSRGASVEAIIIALCQHFQA